MAGFATRRVVKAVSESAWKLRAVGAGLVALSGVVVGMLGSWLAAAFVFTFGMIAVACLVAAFSLAMSLDKWESAPRPYLQFGDGETVLGEVLSLPHPALPTYQGGTVSYPTTATSVVIGGQVVRAFARARVANAPPSGSPGKRAERVTATVRYFNVDGSQLREIQGRWAETRQRAQRPDLNLTFDTVQLDIDANGLPHPLDVAMVDPFGGDIWAYNDDNAGAPNCELESHRLGPGPFLVEITLRAGNALDPVVAVYALDFGGVGKESFRLSYQPDGQIPAPVSV